MPLDIPYNQFDYSFIAGRLGKNSYIINAEVNSGFYTMPNGRLSNKNILGIERNNQSREFQSNDPNKPGGHTIYNGFLDMSTWIYLTSPNPFFIENVMWYLDELARRHKWDSPVDGVSPDGFTWTVFSGKNREQFIPAPNSMVYNIDTGAYYCDDNIGDYHSKGLLNLPFNDLTLWLQIRKAWEFVGRMIFCDVPGATVYGTGIDAVSPDGVSTQIASWMFQGKKIIYNDTTDALQSIWGIPYKTRVNKIVNGSASPYTDVYYFSEQDRGKYGWGPNNILDMGEEGKQKIYYGEQDTDIQGNGLSAKDLYYYLGGGTSNIPDEYYPGDYIITRMYSSVKEFTDISQCFPVVDNGLLPCFADATLFRFAQLPTNDDYSNVKNNPGRNSSIFNDILKIYNQTDWKIGLSHTMNNGSDINDTITNNATFETSLIGHDAKVVGGYYSDYGGSLANPKKTDYVLERRYLSTSVHTSFTYVGSRSLRSKFGFNLYNSTPKLHMIISGGIYRDGLTTNNYDDYYWLDGLGKKPDFIGFPLGTSYDGFDEMFNPMMQPLKIVYGFIDMPPSVMSGMTSNIRVTADGNFRLEMGKAIIADIKAGKSTELDSLMLKGGYYKPTSTGPFQVTFQLVDGESVTKYYDLNSILDLKPPYQDSVFYICVYAEPLDTHPAFYPSNIYSYYKGDNTGPIFCNRYCNLYNIGGSHAIASRDIPVLSSSNGLYSTAGLIQLYYPQTNTTNFGAYDATKRLYTSYSFLIGAKSYNYTGGYGIITDNTSVAIGGANHILNRIEDIRYF